MGSDVVALVITWLEWTPSTVQPIRGVCPAAQPARFEVSRLMLRSVPVKRSLT
jgi:hypothetical protein